MTTHRTESDSRRKAAENPRIASRGKVYHPPVFVTYGNVAKLTQANNGSGNDGGAVGQRMMGACL
jgi:hypothetical protein